MTDTGIIAHTTTAAPFSPEANRLLRTIQEHGADIAIEDAMEWAGIKTRYGYHTAMEELKRAGALDQAGTVDRGGTGQDEIGRMNDDEERGTLSHHLMVSSIQSAITKSKSNQQSIQQSCSALTVEIDRLDLSYPDFPSPPIPYRNTGAESSELTGGGKDITGIKQLSIVIANRADYIEVHEWYQECAEFIIENFCFEIDAMPDTGRGKPGTVGQQKYNRQKSLARAAWNRVFFKYYGPLDLTHAKKLLIAHDYSTERLIEHMASVAPRQHLSDGYVKHPFAYMMEEVETEKNGGVKLSKKDKQRLAKQPDDDLPF